MNVEHGIRLTFDKPGRGRVYDSILETIGNTPLVRISRLAEEAGCQAEVLAKLEFFNPICERQGPHRGLDAGGDGGRGHHRPGQRDRRADLRATPASASPSPAPPRAIAAS